MKIMNNHRHPYTSCIPGKGHFKLLSCQESTLIETQRSGLWKSAENEQESPQCTAENSTHGQLFSVISSGVWSISPSTTRVMIVSLGADGTEHPTALFSIPPDSNSNPWDLTCEAPTKQSWWKRSIPRWAAVVRAIPQRPHNLPNEISAKPELSTITSL